MSEAFCVLPVVYLKAARLILSTGRAETFAAHHLCAARPVGPRRVILGHAISTKRIQNA